MFYRAELAGVKSTGKQQGRQHSPFHSHLLVVLICFLQIPASAAKPGRCHGLTGASSLRVITRDESQ